ncbi:MAG: TIGR02300 family protein [Alphaproteobacteria bacterium]|nr:TIGR02300 family protein [Alphaproteobacteria bacterium]
MAKAEWGLKRICLSCSTKFYDLKKEPIVCPNCGTIFETATDIKSKKGKGDKHKNLVLEDSIIDDDIIDDDEILEDDI